MKFLVFYKEKDRSVTLYANHGTEYDAVFFSRIVTNKISELNGESNSASYSGSANFQRFSETVVVLKILTNLYNWRKFEELLRYLNNFYYVYED